MEDAAPGLYASLKRGYERNIEANRRIGNLEEELEDGGTYQVAEEYSYEIGEALSKAFADGLSSEVLPNGHMYYNIAVRTVDPLIREAWGEAAAAAVKAQENINGAAGLRIRAKQAEFNEDRLHQLINVLTQDGVPYDEVSGILEGKTTNVIQSAVDDTLKTNADFQARAGLSPKIVRIADPKCCEWCQSLEGEYPYPAPKEIYQRHANCECVVDFHAANGRVQNIHTREWREEQRAAEVEERKKLEQEQLEANEESSRERSRRNMSTDEFNVNDDFLKLAKEGNIYVVKTEKLYDYALKIKPIEGFEDYVSHGDPYSIVFKDANGNESNVSAEEFGDILEASGYKGQRMRLIACQIGAGDGLVPTYIAKRFNTEVLAPTEIVNVDFNGNMLLADDENDARMRIETGSWVLFGAKGRIGIWSLLEGTTN